MAYLGKVERGDALDMTTCRPVKVWTFTVYWKREADGVLEQAYRVCSCDQGSARLKANGQRKLDDMVGRFAAFAKRKGYRWEVRRQEKRDRELARKKAESAARERLRLAGPGMLATLQSLLADYRHDGPNGAEAEKLIRETIAKAVA